MAVTGSGVFGGESVLGTAYAQFAIQVAIIVALCRVLAYPFRRWLKQPPVIAEVVAGIVLGPSVLGNIPGFTQAIFPAASLPMLKLFADVGLVYFLFLIGLEADLSLFKRNSKASLLISAAGILLPFGLGAAVSPALFARFPGNGNIAFGTFLAFIALSHSITAFPVLARILLETRMLHTPIGVMTLSAAAVDDIVAWCLLALCVALAHGGQGIVLLYIMLVSVGYLLFMFFPVRLLLLRLLGRYKAPGSMPHLAVTCMLVAPLISGWCTEWIGIHAIFGGFVMGVVTPRHLTRELSDKIEEFVVIVLLPLYFTYSGSRTKIGLLNTGADWGFCVLVITLACFGKICGCTSMTRFIGKRDWAESFTIGFLMNTRGLVELIALNVGLDAGIISPPLFALLVIMALVTTFITSPVVWAIQWWVKRHSTAHRDLPSAFRVMLVIRDPSEAHTLAAVADTLARNKSNPKERPAKSSMEMIPGDNAAEQQLGTIAREQAKAERAGDPARVKQACKLYIFSAVPVSHRPTDYIQYKPEHDPAYASLKDRAYNFGLEIRPTPRPITERSQAAAEIDEFISEKNMDLVIMHTPASALVEHDREALDLPRLAFEHVTTNACVVIDSAMRGVLAFESVLAVLSGSIHDDYVIRMLRRMSYRPHMRITVVFSNPLGGSPKKASDGTESTASSAGDDPVPARLATMPSLRKLVDRGAATVVSAPDDVSFADAIAGELQKQRYQMIITGYEPPQSTGVLLHEELESLIAQTDVPAFLIVKHGSGSTKDVQLP
eukprot:TRINITY_DN4564_c0_g1_i3.p1 TRINITY_DN4564_c0_g1~~TRINITY_DN4564_c0_g1_i3.p1  ORF type:complete len:822 (-),score=300.31 TRINITY_DN4564_c0_g1_i3:271-2607(-)